MVSAYGSLGGECRQVGTVGNMAEEQEGVHLVRPRLYNKFVDEMEARIVRTMRTVGTSGQIQ